MNDAPPPKPPTSKTGRRRRRGRPPKVIKPVAPPPPRWMDELDVSVLPPSAISRVLIRVVEDGLGHDVTVPAIVARGRRPGPVFGLTAAVHGNELNGIRAIHDLFRHMDLASLRGTVVGVTSINVPGLHRHQREFVDGKDLNHVFPGRPHGNVAQVYAHRVVHRIVKHFDYLVDLHTASFGRINSLYVRADMTHPQCSRMAYLQRPQIIVHNPPSDRTLRGAAMDLGIPAITVEIGDPQTYQPAYIRACRMGIRAMLADCAMLPKRSRTKKGQKPVICSHSYWLYTDHGGLLDVLPEATAPVEKGQVVARLRDSFGDVTREYQSPEAGVVVGKSVNPVGLTGARILHLGVVAPEDHDYIRREPLAPTATQPPPP